MDPVRERLLHAAQTRFLAHGFAGTSVGTLCDDAGVSKGAFFHYFDSKQSLMLEIVREWEKGAVAMFASAPFVNEPNPLRRALAFVEFTALVATHPQAPAGCVLGTLAQELSPTDPAARSACGAAFDKWLRPLQADLEAAIAGSPAAGTITARSLVDHFLAVFEGAMVIGKLRGNDFTIVAEQLGHFRRYVEMTLAR